MSLLAALGLKPRRPAAVLVGSSPTADAKGPAVDRNKAAFDAVRTAVQKLVDGLNRHPQKGRIAGPIGNATAKLTAADGHAGRKEWGEAAKRLLPLDAADRVADRIRALVVGS